jgi:hypothetical protein
MFNQKLNDKFTSELKEYCKGKRVLLVGNAASLFNHQHGDLIDSYDVVVRFGKGLPNISHSAHLGKKTDVWFFGSLRASMFKRWVNVPFQVYNYMQISMYDPDCSLLNIPLCVATGEFQVYENFFTLGNFAEHIRLITKIHDKPTKNWKLAPRLSQGALGFLYFDEVINTHSQLDLIGFDFFESEIKYNYKGNEKTVNSWHVPIPSFNSDQPHPHGGSKEKEYILKRISESEGKIKLYPMDTNIKQDVVDMLLTAFRPLIK